MSTERSMWKAVSRAIRGRARGVRVEAGNGEVEEGTPDVVLSFGERTRWVELKVWPNKMLPSQVAWAIVHESCGCEPVLVLVKRGKTYHLMEWRYYGGECYDVRWEKAIWVGHPQDGMLESL